MRVRWFLFGLLVVALAGPALMITVVRAVEPSGAGWVRLVSFTPYAMVLYLGALVLLVVALLFARGAGRRTCGWPCLPVLALVALHVSWVADQYVGRQDAVAAVGEGFTVMAVNLYHGEADPARVMDLARQHDADVMTLSEVTPRALSALRAEGLGRAFPHAAGRPAPEVAGTMVLSRHRLSRVTELDTTFGGWSMRVALPGGAIDLVAVHPPPPLREAREWRLDHVTIRRAATALEGPLVVAGDFNATPDHRPMRDLEGRGLEDAAERSNAAWQPTWPSGKVAVLGVAVPSMLRIDHVLVDDGIGVVDTDAVSVPGTDHRALCARLVLR